MNGKKSSGNETQFSKSRFAILERLHKLRNWIKLLFLPSVAKRSSVPKLSKIVCNENDVIVFDILFCLSGKSYKESNEILNEAKIKLKEISVLNITPENHKRLKDLMKESLSNR